MSELKEASAFWRESLTSWRAKSYKPTLGYVMSRGHKCPAVAYGDPSQYSPLAYGGFGRYDSVYYLLKSGKETYAGAVVAATFRPKESNEDAS